MNRTTILEACNNIAIQIRFDEVETVVGNPDKNAKFLLLALKNGIFRDVYRYHPWSRLRRRQLVTPNPGVTKYNLPGDFGYYVDNTAKRVDSKNANIFGPLIAPDWEEVVAQSVDRTLTVGSAGDAFFTTSGEIGTPKSAVDASYLYIAPEPVVVQSEEAQHLFSYVYITDSIINNTGEGYNSSRIESDFDEPNFDEELVESAGLYRALRMLGLNFADEKAELFDLLKKEASRDSSSTPKRVDMGPRGKVFKANTPGYTRTRGW